MKKLFVLVLLLAMPVWANAELLTYSGTFNGTSSNPDLGTFSGEWEFTQDLSVYNEPSTRYYNVFTLDSLTIFSGPFSLTPGDISATIDIGPDGQLGSIFLFGTTVPGIPVSPDVDDIFLNYAPARYLTQLWGSLAAPEAMDTLFQVNSGGYTISSPPAVPAPQAVWLLASGFALISGLRSRRKAAR